MRFTYVKDISTFFMRTHQRRCDRVVNRNSNVTGLCVYSLSSVLSKLNAMTTKGKSLICILDKHLIKAHPGRQTSHSLSTVSTFCIIASKSETRTLR